jgi:hypothetical protein
MVFATPLPPELDKAAQVQAAIMGRICSVAISPDAQYRIEVRMDETLLGEAYALDYGAERCLVRASTCAGLRNAFATLAQLLLNGDAQPCVIGDTPVLAVRGFMLDVSRNRVPARRTLLHMADLLWLLKYNQFQLYMEHTFAFAGHERVWEAASPFDASAIRWLEDQCAARGVELVPNFNSLGHFGRWLSHPAYRHLAECPDGCKLPDGRILPPGGTTLRPCPETLAFLDSLYDQLLPLFASRQFNAGLDEPWELGMGLSREACGRIGKHRVYLDHLRAVASLAAARGKSLQFWADIVLEAPELVAELPAGVTGLVWGYEASHPFATQCPAFARAAVPYIVCPGTSCWNSVAGRWLNAQANIASATASACANGALGMMLTDWGDNGHHQPMCTSLPPACLFADSAWNGCQKADVAAVIDGLVLRDRACHAGCCLAELSSVVERSFSIRMHNTGAAWKFLFARQEALPGLLGPEDAAKLGDFRREIVALREFIAATRPVGFGGALVAREMDLAARMMDFGARRVQKAIGQPCEPTVDTIPILAERFEELWLERNERGGLSDSLALLRAYRNSPAHMKRLQPPPVTPTRSR